MDANLFSEGSIYYYENNTNTKKDYENENLNHDFLVSRPVYIIGTVSPFQSYTINVLELTSNTKRPGIPINVTGWRHGKIVPYCTYSVHPEYLTRYMGQVNEELQKEIRDAYKYHCGFSTELPIYMKKEQERKLEIDNFVRKLTLKEKSVFKFFNSKCIIGDFLYCNINELWEEYKLTSYATKYETINNFSKAITKLMKLFPEIETDSLEETASVVYTGICLKKNMQLKQTSDNLNILSRKEVLVREPKTLIESDTLTMTSEELLNHLTPSSLKKYEKMDLIDKIKNWKNNPNDTKLDIHNVSDLWVIKRLIALEIEELQFRMFKELEKGINPNALSASRKYILYRSSDDEIQKYVNKKYLKRGIGKLRKQIRASIGYLMR